MKKQWKRWMMFACFLIYLLYTWLFHKRITKCVPIDFNVLSFLDLKCDLGIEDAWTTQRQDADIRRRHRRNTSLTVSTSARQTYRTQWYVPSHWLSIEAVFLLGNACLFLAVLSMASCKDDHVRVVFHRTWEFMLKSYRSFAYWPTCIKQKS